MDFKSNFRDLNIEYSDIGYLAFLTVFSCMLFAYMIGFNLKLGIYCSDVLVYLTNSIRFAGVNLGLSSSMYLSPVICFLSSILIRFGLGGELSIYIVTGIFAVFGNIGLYCLLKTRFDSLLSLTGAVLFSSFSLNVLWLANGTLDIPAVALSIWAIVFTIVALKNSRYFYPAILIWVLAVFTRYTAILILAFMILYYLFERDIIGKLDLLINDRDSFKSRLSDYVASEEFRNILKSAILSILLVSAFLLMIHLLGSRLTFLYQGSSIVSGAKGSLIDKAYTTDRYFYIHDFLNFLFTNKVVFNEKIPVLVEASPLAYLVGFIFILGLIREILFSLKSFDLDKFFNCNDYHLKYLNSMHLSIFAILALILICISFKFSIVLCIAFLFVFSIILSGLFKNEEFGSLNLLFLIWFFSYLLFFTFLDVKVNRYIITALPSFVYFFILALESILDYIKDLNFSALKFDIREVIPIVLIVLAVFSAFSFAGCVEIDDAIKSPELMAYYLMNYDENYSSSQVAVYNVRYYDWLLKMKTIPMEDDKIDVLESSNITYYISDNEFELENYRMIHKENDLYLYRHI